MDDQQRESWWRSRLCNLVLVNLPIDFIHHDTSLTSDLDVGTCEHWEQAFDPQLGSAILDFIQIYHLRPIVFLDSIARVLFYRYSQQSDITWLVSCVSSDVSCAGQKERTDLRLVSRVNCEGQETFVQFCDRLGSFYNQLFENDCKLLTTSPVDEIAKSLEPKSLNVHLICPTSTLVLSRASDLCNVKLVGTSEYQSDPCNNQFDLTIKFNIDKDEFLSISYSYKVNLFKLSTIQRLSNHFINLITSIVEHDSNWLINDHELLGNYERDLIETFNPDYPITMGQEKFFIEMFYQTVYPNSGLIAIKEPSRSITYQQLNEQSNRLANYLTSVHQVKPGDMVALMLPQGIENFISILAVLKLGLAFVPLGIDYPGDRVKFILSDCDNPILITQEVLLSQVSITYGKVLYYSDIEMSLSSQSLKDLPINSSLNDLAYCMYTSGSTGQPKGVLISQRTISYMTTSLNDIFSVNRETRSSLISNTAFDAAICESFPTLSKGGCLILPESENRYNHHYLIDWLIKEHINYCYLPVKLLELIFEDDLHLKVKYPIKIWASGEPLGVVKVDPKVPIEVYNVLGMTELTPLTYVQVNSLKSFHDHMRPPVGSPVPGVKAYIRDSRDRLCPIGVVGEICYSSNLLALGYHKLPEQTEAKFLPDLYNGHLINGSRLLKSGDLARWREDGLIEYFGRADDQIKIRGYRVELPEIEKLLTSFQGINQSKVLVKTDRYANDSRLVAFVVLIDDSQESTSWRKSFGSALHSYLRSNLPYFMLPQVFVIPKFPLNSNGKIDQKGLLQLDNCEPLISSMFQQPLTQIHRDMIKVWSQVLAIPSERIGIDDNFFELGGHSLLAAVIVGKLNQPPYNYPINTRMILTLGSIRSISDLICQSSLDTSIKKIPMIKSRSEIELGVAYSWLVLFELGHTGQGKTNEFTYYLVPDDLDWEQVGKAINYLIERNEAFRVVLSIDQSNRVTQSAIPFTPIKIPLVSCETNCQMVDQANILRSSIANIFNGSTFLVKFLFIQSPNKRLIIMAANHLALDGVSYQMIGQQLTLLLEQLKCGPELHLPPVEVNYLDYIDWENREFYSNNTLMERARQFWVNRLKGFKAPSLPMVVDPLFCIGDEVELVHLWFDENVTVKIENILKEYRTTLFVFTQTLLVTLLYFSTGSTDITIYQAARNMNHHLATGLIGNLAVINFSRVTFSTNSGLTFVNLLRSTHRSIMEEHEFRFYPYQKLIGASFDDDSELMDDETNGTISLDQFIPITLSQGPDQSEPSGFLEGVNTALETMNALVIQFMKIQSRYSIELSFARHGFDRDVIKDFSKNLNDLVIEVTLNPTKPLLRCSENLDIRRWP